MITMNWTVLFKCLVMTIVEIWRFINKTELNLTKFNKCPANTLHLHNCPMKISFVRTYIYIRKY